jgi:hypothetical protein
LIPVSVKQQLNFQLYYPVGLPKGLSVDPTSFKVPSANVMVFVIKDGANKINVSEQVVPPANQLNIDQFYQQNVNGALQFSTSQGHAAVGSLHSDEEFASLVEAVCEPRRQDQKQIHRRQRHLDEGPICQISE